MLIIAVSCIIEAVGFKFGATSVRKTALRALDIKIPTVASVPEIKDDEKSRGAGKMRPRPKNLGWSSVRAQLKSEFGLSDDGISKYESIPKEDLSKAYEMMQMCRRAACPWSPPWCVSKWSRICCAPLCRLDEQILRSFWRSVRHAEARP